VLASLAQLTERNLEEKIMVWQWQLFECLCNSVFHQLQGEEYLVSAIEMQYIEEKKTASLNYSNFIFTLEYAFPVTSGRRTTHRK